MELTLTAELEELIQRHLDSGRYETPYQVVVNAVHQLGRNELNPDMTLAELDAALQEGIDDIDRGDTYSEEEARAYLAAARAERQAVADAKAGPRG
jgi:Arc/MetJ-type ribon-helix-helix transcriptional regulator